VALTTILGGTSGVLGAFLATRLFQRTIDIGMVGNGMIAGLVAITAPSGYIEAWPAPIIGFVAGLIVVAGVIAIDRRLDDPVGALSAHGLAGIWGTLSCGIFTAPRLAQYNAFGDPNGGLIYSGNLKQVAAQAIGVVVAFTFVFAMSYVTFALIKATIGLRVSEDEEDAGLDIVEHGMYGYPEQFIPLPEIGAASHGPKVPGRGAAPPAPVTAMTTSEVTA
jgi:Amt family ammonium transporter